MKSKRVYRFVAFAFCPDGSAWDRLKKIVGKDGEALIIPAPDHPTARQKARPFAGLGRGVSLDNLWRRWGIKIVVVRINRAAVLNQLVADQKDPHKPRFSAEMVFDQERRDEEDLIRPVRPPILSQQELPLSWQ